MKRAPSLESDLHDAVRAAQTLLAAYGLITPPRSSRWLAHLPAPESKPGRTIDDAKAARFAGRLATTFRMGTPVACSGASGIWTTFRVDDRILRVFAKPDLAMCQRIAGLSDLCGPWGPSDIRYDAGGRWLMEKAHPGENLTTAWNDLTPRQRRRLADEIAAVSAVLAVGEASSAEAMRGYELNVQRAAVRLTGVPAHTTAELLATNGTWLHGDIHSENILVLNGKLSAVLDWEHAIVGNSALDAARLKVVLAAQTSAKFADRICGDLDPALVGLAVGVVFGPSFADTSPHDVAVHRQMSEMCVRAIDTLAPVGEPAGAVMPSLIPALIEALAPSVLVPA